MFLFYFFFFVGNTFLFVFVYFDPLEQKISGHKVTTLEHLQIWVQSKYPPFSKLLNFQTQRVWVSKL